MRVRPLSVATGVVVIDPARIERNALPPPVLIESVDADETASALGAPLRIPAGTERLAIHYNGLGLLAPQHVRFRYKLVGYDRDWVDAGTRRVAYYTKLSPGRYEFGIIVADSDDVWNEVAASLAIHRLPQFHQTTAFVASALLAALAAMVGAFGRRVRHHVRAQRALEARVKAATADIKNLRGLLPICAWCQKVRDDSGYWSQIDEYVSAHSQPAFSHGISPDCRKRREELDRGTAAQRAVS